MQRSDLSREDATEVTPSPELDATIVRRLGDMGVSRRQFMASLTRMASLLALPPSMLPQLAMAATSPTKPSVVYMSFQECTGCLESMVNSFAFKGGGTIENLLLNVVSIDYQETLMAAAGAQAEHQLASSTAKSGYVLVVDGSIPASANSGYFVSGGRSGAERFRSAAANAGLIVAVGTCASFGGLPKADPNPTGAVSIKDMMASLGIAKPLINVSGCPPIPEVITGTILLYLASGMPALDTLLRPKTFYGRTVHSHCYREESFEDGPRVKAFDDAASRKGGCLFDMGCKGPVTKAACSSIKWNQGLSFPIQSGHPCMGCTEPNFWDRVNKGGKKGFYVPLAGSYDD
ncbi:hydrogenase small subunit [Oryzibacter oryziterrae]|uniref:hydrogenase small subunit n=1 Tax=Oryzibacter oryziterrae TaxID=2766474 RepID=UPI001F02943D|nr:hydrogenase small subunit [Oryzibacter oryziterrae]